VSSLAIIGRGYTLVSGSRDKNLRTYNLSKDPYNEQQPTVTNAHCDQITALASNKSFETLYSGCRDGSVKVWTGRPCIDGSENLQLDCVATFENASSSQAVNSLCSLDESVFGTEAFACGTNDKTIKIFKLNANGSPQLQDPPKRKRVSKPVITVNESENEEMVFEQSPTNQM
jgi:WD40 repeat protein